jgi:hypothetical protein
MQVESFHFHPEGGWSVDEFPALDTEQTLVLVFGAPGFLGDSSAIDALVRAYPRSHVAGCSSAGEIHERTIRDESLSVAVIRFERATVRLARASVQRGAPSCGPGEAIARQLDAPDLRAVFVLSDGISVNGSDLLRGIHAALSPSVVVTGGLAGDGTRFQHTWVLVDGKPMENMVAAVGFYGDSIGVSHGSRGGWDIFGPERFVTRSAGNVLYELDGEPALELYKTYLGERAAGLPATALLFPLALRAHAGAEKTLVRTILSVDEATQSLTFAGDIPQSSLVQLMRANFDRLIEGASEAGRVAGSAPQGDSLAIAISCVGRRLVLGERTEEEVEAAHEAMPEGSKLVGFYSYGEISPYAAGECGALHNQTMTLTSIWES